MNSYIRLRDYAKYLDINDGDTIFVSSDSKILLYEALKNKEKPDLNQFIDGLIDAVGDDGTIIFPTYNWDFCGGIRFDYHKTKCETGSLGTVALKRTDFKRTKHPIYSFAVYGKYQEKLCSLDNTDSFGLDSPFAFFKDNNVKNYIIDVTLQHCLTYVHFVEEHSKCAKYRYLKNFTAEYTDENGFTAEKTYSMFVRDLDLDVEVTVNPIESDFINQGVEKIFQVNNSTIKRIMLGDAYNILLDDIVHNRAKKLCTYIGQ